jgi:hypothetical protein
MPGIKEPQVVQHHGGQKLARGEEGEDEEGPQLRSQGDDPHHVHRSQKPAHIHPPRGLKHPAPGPGGAREGEGQEKEGPRAHSEGNQGRAHRMPHDAGQLRVHPRLDGEHGPGQKGQERPDHGSLLEPAAGKEVGQPTPGRAGGAEVGGKEVSRLPKTPGADQVEPRVPLEGVVVEALLAFPPGERAAAEIAPRAGKVHTFFHSLKFGPPVDGSPLQNTIPPYPATTRPPSTRICCPVMYPFLSESKKAITSATSSGLP